MSKETDAALAKLTEVFGGVDLTGWAPASNPTMAEKLEGKLLALLPIRKEVAQDERGEDYGVTVVLGFDITDKEPVLIDKELPISWTVARQQLDRTTPENPWLIGRVAQKGRAFLFSPPKPEEVSGISKKLQGVVAALPLIMAAEEVKGEEPF